MKRFMPKWRIVVPSACLYLVALVLMYGSLPAGVQREAIRIDGPAGKPCLGTLWTPPSPKAAIVLGHGVTSNQGIMTAAAKAFAQNGYAVAVFDFWGHGRSRELFDPQSNPAQIHAWCDWTRDSFKDLPLAYLGHSMGGYSGSYAFVRKLDVAAFVAMGALPDALPACKTLIAAGRFEELFSPDEARQSVKDKAEVLISPYSDHGVEPLDPVLLKGVVAWVDTALGVEHRNAFSWWKWLLPLIATVIGVAAALLLAEGATSLLPRPAQSSSAPAAKRLWRVNPYRIAGRVFRCGGDGGAPRSGGFWSAAARGILFGAVFIVLLTWVLDGHVFTCGLNHPGRLARWLILCPFVAVLSVLNAHMLEQVPMSGAFKRFAVAAMSLAVPLLVACFAMRTMDHGHAFLGMQLGILGLILAGMSAVYAMATRGSRDFRAGALAAAMTFSWVVAFGYQLVRL